MSEQQTSPVILLNPGPVNLSPGVRAALQRPDLCHREPEFFALQRELCTALLDVCQLSAENWQSILLGGSGTAALEAMLTSFVPRSGTLLIAENGVYGERLSKIAHIHGIDHHVMHAEWGAELSPSQLAAWLANYPEITHLALVHHETTTGRLNNLAPLAELCREHNVRLLIDAVSSFGAEMIDFEHWPIAAVAATANKCLHGVPGVSLVIAAKQALADSCQPPRTLYLDLAAWADSQSADSTPFTPPVQACYALQQALSELAQSGGWPARQRHYRALADQVTEGLAALGIRPLLPAAHSSVVLRSYYLPAGISYQQLHDGLKQQGFVIYAGQGSLASRLFRISTMGAITSQDVTRLLSAMSKLLS